MEESETKAVGRLHYVFSLRSECTGGASGGSRTQGSCLKGTWLPEREGSLTARDTSTMAFHPDSEDPEASAVLETGACEALSEDVCLKGRISCSVSLSHPCVHAPGAVNAHV